MSDFAERFPHRAILASAGTGKTFQLTNRLIGLLHAGVEPDEILATTFTRKAAGEIRRRLMQRLAEAALDDGECRQLAGHLGAEGLTTDDCLAMLRRVVRSLHRLNLCTLDSFFMRVAGTFSLELGLGPSWRIVEETDDLRLREQAVLAMLTREPLDTMLDLIRLANRDHCSRSAYENLLRTVRDLYYIRRSTDEDAWKLSPSGKLLDSARLTKCIGRFADTPAPLTQKGKPRKRWVDAIERHAEAAREGRWDDFCSGGIVGSVILEHGSYDRVAISDEFEEALRPLIRHAASVLIRVLSRETTNAGELMRRFSVIYDGFKQQRGAYRFDDVTGAVAAWISGDVAGSPRRLDEMAHRLDGFVRHILLDEFQDTSLDQWDVLTPLAERVLAQAPGPHRSFFVVGDKKQAIYGWREGRPELLSARAEDPRIRGTTLARSYRSSQVVIDLANRVFGQIADNPVFSADADREAAADWAKDFTTHTCAKDLPGHAELIVVPKAADKDQTVQAMLGAAAETVRDILADAPGCSVGILFRKNSSIPRMIHALRARGIFASEEGGNPLTDCPAVSAALSLLTLADHPGHTAAAFHVCTSPLKAVIEAESFQDADAICAAARRLRRRLQVYGYAHTLRGWLRKIAAQCDGRDFSRFEQLIEMAQLYDRGAGVRTMDFVRRVRETRVEDPTSAGVRVMTVHQAKGLQFDAVVLPELGDSFHKVTPAVLTRRPDPLSRPVQVCRYRSEYLCRLHPDLSVMLDQHRQRTIREELCNLYVALTRAVHAAYMIVQPPPKTAGPSQSFAGILRAALVEGQEPEAPATLWSREDPDGRDWRETRAEAARPQEPETVLPRVAEAAETPERNIHRLTPTGLVDGCKGALEQHLRLDESRAMHLGTLFHAWFELVEWLDESVPDESTLRAVAAPLGLTDEGDLREQIDRFRAMCKKKHVLAALSRSAYPAGDDVDVRVYRELPFAVREADGLLSGKIDRLVIGRKGGTPTFAEIIDYKTDRAEGDAHETMERLREHYQPQLDAYRRAISKRTSLPPEDIRAELLFVNLAD